LKKQVEKHMKKKKIISTILAACTLITVLSGCANLSEDISFSNDGSGTITAELYIPAEVYESTGTEPEEGYTTKVIDGKTYYGTTESEDFADVAELNEIFENDKGPFTIFAREYYSNDMHLVDIDFTMDNSTSAEEETDTTADDDFNVDIDMSGVNSLVYSEATYTITFPEGIDSVVDFAFCEPEASTSGSHYTKNGNSITISSEGWDNAVGTVLVTGVLGKDTRESKIGVSNISMTRPYRDNFTDVSSDAWYYSAVKKAYEYGFINGTTDTKFSPNNDITLAELITMCARVHDTYYTNNTDFTLESNSDPWYKPYVDYAIKNGIITATDFSDMTKVATREQTAYILAHVFPIVQDNVDNSKAEFSDIANSKYHDEIMLIYSAGVTSGIGNNQFGPNASLTRSQAAQFILNLIESQR
jgi:hypothetical protein